MRITFRWAIFAIGSALSVIAAQAAPFEVLGVRALGMGGAQVAAVRDGTASYWNPGILGFFGRDEKAFRTLDSNGLADKDWGFGLDAGLHLAVHGKLAEVVDTISVLDYAGISQAVQNNQTFTPQQMADAVRIVHELAKLSEQDAFTGGASGLADLRIGSVAIGGHLIGGVAISAQADVQNLGFQQGQPNAAQALAAAAPVAPAGWTPQYFTPAQATQLQATLTTQYGLTATQAQNVVAAADQGLAAQPQAAGQQQAIAQTITTIAGAGGGNFANNQSIVRFRGAAIAEFPIAYGHAFSPRFALGIAIKPMRVALFARDEKIFQQRSANFTNANTTRTQSGLGVDLGLVYRTEHLYFGVLARNLNAPRFSADVVNGNTGLPTGERYTFRLKPQLRAGIAWMPTDTLTFAIDGDLTANESLIPNRKSRLASAGIEWDIAHFLALRFGAMKNLVSGDDIGVIYTAGLGLNLWLLRLDAALAASAKKATFKGKKRTQYLQAALGVRMDF